MVRLRGDCEDKHFSQSCWSQVHLLCFSQLENKTHSAKSKGVVPSSNGSTHLQPSTKETISSATMVPDGKKKYSQTGNSARRALFFSSLVAVTFACCVMVYNLMEPDCPVARVQQEHSLMCPPRECPEQPAPTVKVEHTLAFRESLEFFDDVDDREWNMMKQKVKDIHPNTKGDPNKFDHYDELHYYWQDHYEPNFSCRHERRIGPLGDGGKWVCDAHRYKTKDCLVYSVGSNGEYGFEAAVLSEIGPHCEVHTFDFDDYSAEAIEGVNFHQWGLAEKTYEKKRGWFDAPIQLKTLQQTVEELGHTGRTISLFKIGTLIPFVHCAFRVTWIKY